MLLGKISNSPSFKALRMTYTTRKMFDEISDKSPEHKAFIDNALKEAGQITIGDEFFLSAKREDFPDKYGNIHKGFNFFISDDLLKHGLLVAQLLSQDLENTKDAFRLITSYLSSVSKCPTSYINSVSAVRFLDKIFIHTDFENGKTHDIEIPKEVVSELFIKSDGTLDEDVLNKFMDYNTKACDRSHERAISDMKECKNPSKKHEKIVDILNRCYADAITIFKLCKTNAGYDFSDFDKIAAIIEKGSLPRERRHMYDVPHYYTQDEMEELLMSLKDKNGKIDISLAYDLGKLILKPTTETAIMFKEFCSVDECSKTQVRDTLIKLGICYDPQTHTEEYKKLMNLCFNSKAGNKFDIERANTMLKCAERVNNCLADNIFGDNLTEKEKEEVLFKEYGVESLEDCDNVNILLPKAVISSIYDYGVRLITQYFRTIEDKDGNIHPQKISFKEFSSNF